MKSFRFLFLAVLVAFTFSCDNDYEPQEAPRGFKQIEGEISILPLGDSRVQGNRPFHESYRYELWKLLVDTEADIDFVGPQDDPGSYPTYNGQTFDNDHAGIGGDKTNDILDRLNEALFSTERVPRYVLLGIGGNDLLEEEPLSSILENLNQIIDEIQAENLDVTILVEQIAPGRSDLNTPELLSIFSDYNQEVLTIAEQQSTERSRVIAIDMFSDWSDEYMSDPVHYSEAGAKEIADRYFAVLDSLIN